MLLSWQQSGSVSNYIIELNDASTSSFNLLGVGNVSVTVSDLTSGTYYCVSVIAVSGHLHSDKAHLCNYTGKNILILTDNTVRNVGYCFTLT